MKHVHLSNDSKGEVSNMYKQMCRDDDTHYFVARGFCAG